MSTWVESCFILFQPKSFLWKPDFVFKEPALELDRKSMPQSGCCLVVSDSVTLGFLQARILEWVAFSFSRGSSQPRNWTRVSCIAGRFLPTELLSYQGMGCKTGRGACSPPGSSLRRVSLGCSETVKRWSTIWRQIFLSHAQRNMLYLENTCFINLIIFVPDFWMNPLPWARFNWQSNQHSYMAERQATWPFISLNCFSLINPNLLLIVPLCHASNDFALEDQNLFNIWNTP